MRLGLQLSLGFFLMVGLATFFVLRVFVTEVKPGVRQAMESTLVDAANVLAVMAANDLKTGRFAEGAFARSWDEARRRELRARVWQLTKRRIDYRLSVTDARGIVVYDSEGKDLGRDNSRWNDVYATLRGKYGARSSPEQPGDDSRTVMHVAAPIYDPADPEAPGKARRILGVLTVSQANHTFEPFIESGRRDIVRRGAWLIGLSALIALAMTAWLVIGIQRLRRYALAVSAGEPVPPPPRRRDELGDLGQALETMRRKLEGKAYVEEYVQSLTHELKGPLAAIRGAAELLQEPLPDDDRQRFVQHIRAQEERLTETIDKLLALAEVEQHGWLRKQEPVDVAALLAQAADDAAAKLAAAELRLVIEVGEGVAGAGGAASLAAGGAASPAAGAAGAAAKSESLRPSSLPLRGDAYLLRQALANLLDNAIAFSPAGSVIELAARRADAHFELTVRDRGPGIPDYAEARVFERFYSLPRPSSGRKSSGLGLPFVREVARLHGGTADLHNREGGGAEATLRLPQGGAAPREART